MSTGPTAELLRKYCKEIYSEIDWVTDVRNSPRDHLRIKVNELFKPKQKRTFKVVERFLRQRKSPIDVDFVLSDVSENEESVHSDSEVCTSIHCVNKVKALETEIEHLRKENALCQARFVNPLEKFNDLWLLLILMAHKLNISSRCILKLLALMKQNISFLTNTKLPSQSTVQRVRYFIPSIIR